MSTFLLTKEYLIILQNVLWLARQFLATLVFWDG